MIIITHDNDIARRADRVIKIRDGRIESDTGRAAREADSLQIVETGQEAKETVQSEMMIETGEYKGE